MVIITQTIHHNEWHIHIMGLWLLITIGQMSLSNVFVTERLTAHITPIWTLPNMYTLMFLQVPCFTECFITHFTSLLMLLSMYMLMYPQVTVSACSTTVQSLLAQWDSCQTGILWWKEWSQYAHYRLSSQSSYTVFSNEIFLHYWTYVTFAQM